MLISLINYRFWAENEGETISVPSKHEETFIKDSKKARSCPKCSRLMTKYRICASSDNRVDLCAGCDEVWLDSGEWQLLKRLDISQKLSSFFTDAWQRKIRLEQEAVKLKAHYEQLIGAEDFLRLTEFKTWLDQHPQKAEIKHYVNTSFG